MINGTSTSNRALDTLLNSTGQLLGGIISGRDGTATRTTSTTIDWQKYLPWAVGAAAVVAVLVFLARKP